MTHILVVDDEPRMAGLIKMELEDHGHTVTTAGDGTMALDLIEKGDFDLIITDLRMPGIDGLEILKSVKEQQPDTEVILMTAYASAQTAIRAMKEGAYDYLIKPFEMDELILMVKRIGEKKQLSLENMQLREEISRTSVTILGESQNIKEVLELVEKVAGQDATVLIEGESGTGKELVARAIHIGSLRSRAPFIVVNCAAIPDTLIESELFGYERGAFTGADSRRLGRFELANRGTLFLDEVSELTAQAQVKLLRVLQERTLERLGGTDTITVNVRVLAATNRDLRLRISSGQFREDLYYRLNVFPIRLPALRERREDIPLLARYFVEKQRRGNTLTGEAEEILSGYEWPGNVRELENVIERATILAGEGKEIDSELFAYLRAGSGLTGEDVRITIPDDGVDIEDLEKQHILEALKKAGGNKSEAARLLYMTRRRLYSRMTHHGIDY